MSLSSASPESRKLALIIGQNEYQYLDKLELSKPDAELMHKTLQNLGFETLTPPLIDKTNKELQDAFSQFSWELKAGDLVFFYYSGHAYQQTIDNKTDNYIFGIDAKEEIINGKKVTAGIALHSKILRNCLNEKCLYLIVIDACRIFPNKDQKFKAGSKSEQRQVQSEMSLIPACLPQDITHREYDVVYACQPGFGAIENTDREVGYLASALSNAMNKPGSWSEAIPDVIQQVQRESGYRQKPSVSVNISKKLYFKQNVSDVSEVSTDQKASFVVPRPEIPIPVTPEHPQPTFDQSTDDCLKMTSLQYREPQTINANELREQIKTRFVGNVCVNIETSLFHECIEIQGQVTLHNITFTNAKKGAWYVRFNIPDDNTKITIIDCKFEGIGVIVSDPDNQKRGDVVVRNTEFNNMPRDAIIIEYCNKCIIEHVKVQGCGSSGVYLNVTEGTLEDVHVSDCQLHGIYIRHVPKSISINNSSICNCKQYGLYIHDNNASVQGANVTFENNTKGNVYGNFRQN